MSDFEEQNTEVEDEAVDMVHKKFVSCPREKGYLITQEQAKHYVGLDASYNTLFAQKERMEHKVATQQIEGAISNVAMAVIFVLGAVKELVNPYFAVILTVLCAFVAWRYMRRKIDV